MTELSGYQFRMLREDSEFALFRGERAGDAVSILVLEPVAERPAPASLPASSMSARSPPNLIPNGRRGLRNLPGTRAAQASYWRTPEEI